MGESYYMQAYALEVGRVDEFFKSISSEKYKGKDKRLSIMRLEGKPEEYEVRFECEDKTVVVNGVTEENLYRLSDTLNKIYMENQRFSKLEKH